jgi:hypothetical protein
MRAISFQRTSSPAYSGSNRRNKITGTRCASASLGFAPGAEIYRVERNAKHVGRNEAELRGAESDHADDSAVDSGQNPALPTTLAQQDGRRNCKNARQVIQTKRH